MSVELTIRMRLTAETIVVPELNERLGLAPTSTWRCGDPVARSPILTHKDDGWVREVAVDEMMDLAPGLEAVVREWLPRKDALRRWMEDSGGVAVVRCNVTTLDGGVPAMWIEPGLLEAFGSLGVALDIDVLCPGPE